MNLTEVQLLLAAPQAAQGYTTPGSVYNSNGRWASTTQLNATTTLDNLFPDLTGPQNAASQVDYQALFIYNSDPTDTMTNVWAWLASASVAGPIDWAVGADSTGISIYNSIIQQAGFIAAPTLAPTTVSTWHSPSSSASGGAQLPSIGPGQVAPIWIRRTGTNSSAYQGAGFNLQVTFSVNG